MTIVQDPYSWSMQTAVDVLLITVGLVGTVEGRPISGNDQIDQYMPETRSLTESYYQGAHEPGFE